jgi:type II secretory pathway component PulF
MPLYGYEAVDNKGRTLKGAIEADNEQLVLAKLHEQGLHVVRVAPQRTKTQLFSGFGKSKKPKLQALVLFTRQFATMIDAGIPSCAVWTSCTRRRKTTRSKTLSTPSARMSKRAWRSTRRWKSTRWCSPTFL